VNPLEFAVKIADVLEDDPYATLEDTCDRLLQELSVYQQPLLPGGHIPRIVASGTVRTSDGGSLPFFALDLMRVSRAQLQEVDDELEERLMNSLDQHHQRGWLHGDIEHGMFSSALQTQGPVWVDFRCASRIDNKRQITAEVDECRRIMLRSMCGPSTRSAALMCLSTCRLALAGPIITSLYRC
jgi:hypothetical protein